MQQQKHINKWEKVKVFYKPANRAINNQINK